MIIFKMISKAEMGLMLHSYADTQSKQAIYIPQLSRFFFSNPVEFALLNMYSCKMLSAYLIRISHYMIKLLMSRKTANEDLNKFQELRIKNMP